MCLYVCDPNNFFIMLIIRIKWTFTIIIKSYYYDYDSTCKPLRLSVGSDFFAIADIPTICTGTSRQFFIANKKRLQPNIKCKYMCEYVSINLSLKQKRNCFQCTCVRYARVACVWVI